MSVDRRDVAKRMRDYALLRSPDTFEAFFTRLNGVLFGDDGLERPDGEIFGRLADLIDPTCDFEESADNDEFAIRVVSGYICHNCGHETIVERTAGGWTEPPRYCSNCGARMS